MFSGLREGETVLVLGDGDFSFSKALLCKLANLNCSIIATAYDSETGCYSKYPDARQNVHLLKAAGCETLFNVDATRLNVTDELREKTFELIIFNFPHTGGKTNLRLCKALLKGIFLSCSSLLSNETGRFCLTLAKGQSGFQDFDVSFMTDDQLPAHNMDSWQALYLSPYANLILDSVVHFPASELISLGYKCTGYKNASRQFHIDDAQVLLFRRALSISPENLDTPEIIDESLDSTNLHNLRPFYVHDIAFWVNDGFRVEIFESICRQFSKGLIKRITFLSEYSLNDDRYKEKNLRTLCFRLVWQSSNYAITRESCRDMQILLRDHLQRYMPDSLSFLLR